MPDLTHLGLPPLDLRHGRIDMTHGAGGRASAQLIEALFQRHLGNAYLQQGDDGALLPAGCGRLVMSTDSHVVSPLFFPGGDIGSLSVHGTLNDVAVMGARPCWLSAGFIIEEGFPLADLDRIVASMAAATRAAGVPLVTADTKVVGRGQCDGLYITTTGIGFVSGEHSYSGRQAQPGDAILISGTLGDHGMAILSARDGLGFASDIRSDSAALHGLIAQLQDSGSVIHTLRDPTRGGLAATLNEIARQSGVGMRLDEAALPVKPAVAAACEFLGLDPLHIANEGKLLLIAPAADAPQLLTDLQAHPLGREARIIGHVQADPQQRVQMTTLMGGTRIVDWLTGDPLPRIC